MFWRFSPPRTCRLKESTSTGLERMIGEMATTTPSEIAANPRPWRATRVTASQMGIAAGVLAVVAGAFFEVRPPEAYGICMACHGRDLVNWTINTFAHTHFEVAPASLVYPVLTTIGALLGALLGAVISGEFRWRSPENPLMTFALIAGGCSIRLLLRASAGEALGVIGFAGMVAGVIFGTLWLRWRATR